MPAQFTRIRADPCSDRAFSTAFAPEVSLATSHSIAIPPISLAIEVAASILLSNIATRAPADANIRAVPAPNPPPPPVIKAACPAIIIKHLRLELLNAIIILG
jgi:hypothetical protein